MQDVLDVEGGDEDGRGRGREKEKKIERNRKENPHVLFISVQSTNLQKWTTTRFPFSRACSHYHQHQHSVHKWARPRISLGLGWD